MEALEKLLANIKRTNREIKANLSSKYTVGEPRSENAKPYTRKVYIWILYGCKGNSMMYLQQLYGRLDRIA